MTRQLLILAPDDLTADRRHYDGTFGGSMHASHMDAVLLHRGDGLLEVLQAKPRSGLRSGMVITLSQALAT